MDSLATGLQSALSPLHGAGEDLVRIYLAGAADEVDENLCCLNVSVESFPPEVCFAALRQLKDANRFHPV